MKTISFFILIIISLSIDAQVMWQIRTDTVQKWFYQDGDEFNHQIIDESKWRFGMPWGNVLINQDLAYQRNNIIINNGIASFIAKKENISVPINEWEINNEYLEKNHKKVIDGMYNVNYTAGMLSSRKKFKYGYFELRFKSNNEKGIWPAFWLFGGNPNEEIDFFELKGERKNQIHIDVHCPKGCEDYKGGFLHLMKNWGAWITTTQNLSSQWNIISGEWQPGFVKFFLNGQPIGFFEGDFKTEQNLLINTCVAKDGEAFNPGPDKTTKWPNVFDVDYVRIWSKEDTNYDVKDKYKLFENTALTISNDNIQSAELKRKNNYVYHKKLDDDFGTISLIPILYNKYSLSISGKKLKNIQIQVMDRFNTKVAGFFIKDLKYQVLDLSSLPTGPYTIIIKVFNQILTHQIPIINPEKIGEE